MDEATKQAFLSALRSILVAVGSWLTARGYINADDAQALIAGTMTLLPIAWGIRQKYCAEIRTRQLQREAYAAGATNMPIPQSPGGPK